MKNGKLKTIWAAAALPLILAAPGAGAFGAVWHYSDPLTPGNGAGNVIVRHGDHNPRYVVQEALDQCRAELPPHIGAHRATEELCNIQVFVNACGAAAGQRVAAARGLRETARLLHERHGNNSNDGAPDPAAHENFSERFPDRTITYLRPISAAAISAPGDERDSARSLREAQQQVRDELARKCETEGYDGSASELAELSQQFNGKKLGKCNANWYRTRMRVRGECTYSNLHFDWEGYKHLKWAAGKKSALSCPADRPFPESDGGCREVFPNDCTGNTPVYEPDANGFPACRGARSDDECGGDTPRADRSGRCRALNAEDCRGILQTLDNGRCRETRPEDCTGNTPILDRGLCRAAVAADCTGNTPVADNGRCRARRAADCGGSTPIFDRGECRALAAADCQPGTSFHNGECINSLVHRCISGQEQPRRIFRPARGATVPGSFRRPGYDINRSQFYTVDFKLHDTYLTGLYADIGGYTRVHGIEGGIYEEGVRRIWLKDGRNWLRPNEHRHSATHLTPVYNSGGRKVEAEAGDVISVLLATNDKLDEYAPELEGIKFRVHRPKTGRNLQIALGEDTPEVGCQVTGNAFFLRDDFTPTTDFSEAGTNF